MKDPRNDRTLGWRMHPIWRGIGFILLILIPVISFGISEAILKYTTAEYPELLSGNPQIIDGIEDLYLQLGLTLVVSVIFFLVMSILVSLLYSLLGGSENEELVSRIGSGRKK
jgi:hypothetical protein